VGVRTLLIFQTVTAVSPLWTHIMNCNIETAVMLPSTVRGQENSAQKTVLQLSGEGLLLLTFTELLSER
jgi:hypothetical protein